MDSFDKLGVNDFLVEKLKTRSIVKPTAIQSMVIPRLLAGKSLVFRSATGTGKTFAYLLPVLNAISYGGGVQVLICAPTLELCSQIKAEVDFLSSVPAALLIGSVKLDHQIENFKKSKATVAVGNPARLLVLAKMGKLKFNALEFLILDEADRLTAQECMEETKELLKIIERDVKRRENGSLRLAACSATVGKKTAALLGALFANAEIVESEDNEILRGKIEHWAIFSEKRRKDQTLRSLLYALKAKKPRIKVLIFTSRGDEAGLFLSRLQYHHIPSAGLFAKVNKKPLSNAQRKTALNAFREGSVTALVSTDLAARGLDIPDITHVVALDVPADSEVYIHRCGRTGRAGKRGVMVTIGDETQMRLLVSLEKKLKIRVLPKELRYGQIRAPLLEEE